MTTTTDEGRLVTPATEADLRLIEAKKRYAEKVAIYREEPERFLFEVLGVRNLWDKQVEIIRSVKDNKRTAVPSGHNLGKALALDTPLPTPGGWTDMESVGVGDWLLNEDGKTVKVVTTSPMHERECYRVVFSDGSEIIASDDHRWSLYDGESGGSPSWEGSRVLTTTEVSSFGCGRWLIPAGPPCSVLRSIVAIEPVGKRQVKCVGVDSPMHLYLAGESMIPTHNTFLSGSIPWWWMLNHAPTRKVIIISSSNRQAIAQLGGEFHARYQYMVSNFSPEFMEGVLGIRTKPNTEGWKLNDSEFVKWFATSADTGSSEHATKMAGYHADHLLYIFDEAGGIPKVIWDSIQGSLSGEHRHFLAIGQPVDPTSEFARFCRRDSTNTIRLDCTEHPNVVFDDFVLPYGPTRQWVDDMKEYPGENSGQYQFKVRGLFPLISDENLISHADMNLAFEREPDPLCEHSPAWISVACDVARFGNDNSVVIALCTACGAIVDAEEHAGQDTVATTGMVIRVAKDLNLDPVAHSHQVGVDDVGVGGGVTDQLRAQGWIRARGINTAEKPTYETELEKFYNLRAQLWWDARTWLRKRACLGNLDMEAQDALRDELTSPKYTYDGSGRIVLEPKKDFKKRIGHSPDHADTLVMAVHLLPVAGKLMHKQISEEEFEKKNDPYWERDFGNTHVRDEGYAVNGSYQRASPRKILSDW